MVKVKEVAGSLRDRILKRYKCVVDDATYQALEQRLAEGEDVWERASVIAMELGRPETEQVPTYGGRFIYDGNGLHIEHYFAGTRDGKVSFRGEVVLNGEADYLVRAKSPDILLKLSKYTPGEWNQQFDVLYEKALEARKRREARGKRQKREGSRQELASNFGL